MTELHIWQNTFFANFMLHRFDNKRNFSAELSERDIGNSFSSRKPGTNYKLQNIWLQESIKRVIIKVT